jgi:hypothetical protein
MSASTVGQLVTEVATLLRHDNIDERIKSWLYIAMKDIHSRAATWRTLAMSTALISAGDHRAAASSTGQIVALGGVYETSGIVCLPNYVQPTDFRRLVYSQGGNDISETGGPLIWTMLESTTSGRVEIAMYPTSTVDVTFYFLTQSPVYIPENSAEFYFLPYHWENVLIWGAAAFGAQALASNLYPLFQGEYEEAIHKMIAMLTYRPDSTPVLRSVVSPYGGTISTRRYRLPDNITE